MSVNRRSEKTPGKVTYFFITSILTLVISTFLLNSGGNLVRLISFASTLDAIFARVGGEGRKAHDEQTREIDVRGVLIALVVVRGCRSWSIRPISKAPNSPISRSSTMSILHYCLGS